MTKEIGTHSAKLGFRGGVFDVMLPQSGEEGTKLLTRADGSESNSIRWWLRHAAICSKL